MKRICTKSKNFKEAELKDILQHIKMTPEQRQQVAFELRMRVFGENVQDIRDYHKDK